MNERLKELLEQATEVYDQWHRGESVCMVDYKIFAELIAKECADLCDRFQARDVGMQPAECAGAIRKMFGVEE